jgi:hypothetical protein
MMAGRPLEYGMLDTLAVMKPQGELLKQHASCRSSPFAFSMVQLACNTGNAVMLLTITPQVGILILHYKHSKSNTGQLNGWFECLGETTTTVMDPQ